MDQFKCVCSGINDHHKIFFSIVKNKDIFRDLMKKKSDKCIIKNVLRFCSHDDNVELWIKIINNFPSLLNCDMKNIIELLIRKECINCLITINLSLIFKDVSYLILLCYKWNTKHIVIRNMIDYLMKYNINLEYCDDLGNTILINAINQRDIQSVEYLLSIGCDPNKGNYKTGCTPIICSIKKSNFRIFKILIKHNVNITLTDFDGNSISNHIILQMIPDYNNIFGYTNIIGFCSNGRNNNDKLKIITFMNENNMMTKKKNQKNMDFYDIIVHSLTKDLKPLLYDQISSILDISLIQFDNLSISSILPHENTIYIDENYLNTGQLNTECFYDDCDVQNNIILRVFHKNIFNDIITHKISQHPFTNKNWPGLYGNILKKNLRRILSYYEYNNEKYPILFGPRGGKYIIMNNKKKYIS